MGRLLSSLAGSLSLCFHEFRLTIHNDTDVSERMLVHNILLIYRNGVDVTPCIIAIALGLQEDNENERRRTCSTSCSTTVEMQLLSTFHSRGSYVGSRGTCCNP
eukprot:scaffold367_cov202-Alexandrium_tamarense.AAC.7